MANIYGPILPIQLDGRNTTELLRAIQTRINLESGGALNDFTPASPLSAITEGQAFAESELLFYLNNLPEAFTLQWLRLLGIQRKLGSRAYVDVTFFKVPGFNGAVVIPTGTRVLANTLAFVTLEEVRISEEEVGKSVACRSEKWGSVYNVGINSINKIERNYAGLQSLTNQEAATGGSDLESIDDMKKRAFEVLGKRNLTTSNDFDTEVKSVVADAAIVKTLTYEERFSVSRELSGNVVVVVGNSEGKPLNNSSLALIVQSLRPRVTLGTNISLLAPEIVPVDVIVEVYYNPLNFPGNSDQYANQVFTILNSIISPTYFTIGDKLDRQRVSRELLNLDFISNINVLDLRLMQKDPETLDGPCAGFKGEEFEEKCLYKYLDILDKDKFVTDVFSPITSYRLYRTQIALTSENDFSSLIYTFDSLYTP